MEWYILCNLNVFLIAIFRLGNLGKDVCRPTKCRGKRKLRFTSHLNLCFRQLPHFVSVFVRKVGSHLHSSSIFIREKVRWGFLHSYALQCDMILKGVNVRNVSKVQNIDFWNINVGLPIIMIERK